jgi:hypothetical protein
MCPHFWLEYPEKGHCTRNVAADKRIILNWIFPHKYLDKYGTRVGFDEHGIKTSNS